MFIIMIGYATELPNNLCMTALLYRVFDSDDESGGSYHLSRECFAEIIRSERPDLSRAPNSRREAVAG